MNMKYNLTRTGRAPLGFDGEKIAEVSTYGLRGDEQNRWYEIAIYKADDLYAAHVGYRTKWKGELDTYWLEVSVMKGVTAWLSHDIPPIPIGAGFPPRKEFEERQAALRNDLISQYRYAVSKVLEDFPEVLGEFPKSF